MWVHISFSYRDGQRYKGRGLIQLTGLGNYKAFQKWLKGAPDIIKNPHLLEQPHLATLASCWFWDRVGICIGSK